MYEEPLEEGSVLERFEDFAVRLLPKVHIHGNLVLSKARVP